MHIVLEFKSKLFLKFEAANISVESRMGLPQGRLFGKAVDKKICRLANIIMFEHILS